MTIRKKLLIAVPVALLLWGIWSVVVSADRESRAVDSICAQAAGRGSFSFSQCDREGVKIALHKMEVLTTDPDTLDYHWVSTAEAYNALSTLVRASDGTAFGPR